MVEARLLGDQGLGDGQGVGVFRPEEGVFTVVSGLVPYISRNFEESLQFLCLLECDLSDWALLWNHHLWHAYSVLQRSLQATWGVAIWTPTSLGTWACDIAELRAIL